MPSVDLTISIVNYNTKDYLQQCLYSILAGTQRLTFEVIVVDNASHDDTRALVGMFPDVKWIFNTENRFFMKAHNQALAAGDGRFFMVLNPDTVVPPGTLESLVAFLSDHPETGAVTCRELDAQNRLMKTGARFPTPLVEIVEWTGLRKWFSRQVLAPYRMDDWDRTTSRPIDVACGCFIMARTDILKRAGGLNENIRLYFSEYDLCAKVADAGLQVQFLSDVFYIHHGQRSSVQQDPTRIRKIYLQDMKAYYQSRFGWIKATSMMTAIRSLRFLENVVYYLMPARWLRFAKRKIRQLV